MLLDDGTGRKKERRVSLPLRVPESLFEAVYKIAGWKKVGEEWTGPRGMLTATVESIVRLGVHVAEVGRPEKLRWQQFAIDNRLDFHTQWPEIVMLAAKLGLEAHEKKRK